ncbi:hypothetical protein AB0L17_36335, partial [Streptomyces cellulosae]
AALIVDSQSVKGASTISRNSRGYDAAKTTASHSATDHQVWADRGYADDLVDWARERLWLTLRVISRPKGTKGPSSFPAAGKSSARSAGA